MSDDSFPRDRDRWMNSGQAADYIGYRINSIRNMVYRGEISFTKTPSGRLRFRKSELDAWMEAKEEQQPAPAGVGA